VEYRLPRISQVQLHEKIGLTFSSVLRATLRQDPDILLVGEIRDAESAEIALRASMTGHLVLSTLHTNDAISSALRLLDIGVDGYLVATALKAVVAQRLVRRICSSCIQNHTPDANELQLLASISKGKDFSSHQFKQGAGCPHCNNTGYRGRIGVFEMLELDAPMAEALRKSDINGFSKAANQAPNFKTLSQAALEYAEQGITSLDEVMSITAQIEEFV
jgi:MSHA biogenesis protein MshE